MLVGCDISAIFKQQAATFLPLKNVCFNTSVHQIEAGLYYYTVLCVISAHLYIYSLHARTFL